MTAQQLFPREPRRMKQPRKDLLRDALAKAATTIADQRMEIEHMDAQLQSMREAYAVLWAKANDRRWWRRLFKVSP